MEYISEKRQFGYAVPREMWQVKSLALELETSKLAPWIDSDTMQNRHEKKNYFPAFTGYVRGTNNFHRYVDM